MLSSWVYIYLKQDWLLQEIRRLQDLDYLVKKFNLRCATHESWSQGKEEVLNRRDFEQETCFPVVKALSQKHSDFEADLGLHQTRVEDIVAIAEQLK